MDTQIKDGGYVFPTQMVTNGHGEIFPATAYADVGGMTLRDWLAGMTMQSIIPSAFRDQECTYKAIAARAYAMADAMIKEKTK